MISSANPMLLTDEEFEKKRYVLDPPADNVAFAILNLFDHDQVYRILGQLEKNSDRVSFDSIQQLSYKTEGKEEHVQQLISITRKWIEDYFNDLTHFQFTPEEKACLARAAAFFNTHMAECTLALATRSLLKQYAAYKSTNVLTYTQMLPKYPYRRIISTMQFVMDVMDVKAFEPDGYGIRSIQKLRLVHALIRNRIDVNTLKKIPGAEWDQAWGAPINQQDMIFAIHTFSIEVIHGLIASGEYVNAEEVQNYYYAWHLIGRALGVQDSMNPSDYLIGVKVQNRIYAKEFIKNNPNGPVLAEPLLAFLGEVMPLSNRRAVLGLVKLFNDVRDYDPIFRDILHIDLSQASDSYVKFYRTADRFSHMMQRIKYFFQPRSKKELFHFKEADAQHQLFEKLIGAAKTWSNSHFRIADGFGTQAAIDHATSVAASQPLWKRVLRYFFGEKQ